MAQRLGTRQQTISEWERGVYSPRGISSAMLSVLAERSDFEYGSPTPRRRPRA